MALPLFKGESEVNYRESTKITVPNHENGGKARSSLGIRAYRIQRCLSRGRPRLAKGDLR
ncbi:unnamed protein product [Sphenostylis stenocarpa]|uniref:Uncharacterized protein n=1 Tax=Sphenostylis stenocarpa TaxID=92480 RepID=A0AA86S422_9FABA|nr:unnamed protein product [Sphenostylis stenocarpa]